MDTFSDDCSDASHEIDEISLIGASITISDSCVNDEVRIEKYNASPCESPATKLILLHAQTSPPLLKMNKGFAQRLLYLRAQASHMQYQMACLNTLGGAYHLCQYNQDAFLIAKRQEQLGRRLGSTSMVLRAKGFCAINIGTYFKLP